MHCGGGSRDIDILHQSFKYVSQLFLAKQNFYKSQAKFWLEQIGLQQNLKDLTKKIVIFW